MLIRITMSEDFRLIMVRKVPFWEYFAELLYSDYGKAKEGIVNDISKQIKKLEEDFLKVKKNKKNFCKSSIADLFNKGVEYLESIVKYE